MKKIKIKFNTGIIEAKYDSELIQFLDCIPPDSCNKEDVRIMSTYFYNVVEQWPATFYPAYDKFISYSVVDDGQKKQKN